MSLKDELKPGDIKVIPPQCSSCKNKIDNLTCAVYEIIPFDFVFNEKKCPKYINKT